MIHLDLKILTLCLKNIKDFKIIVLNNAGGGIFRILPGNKDEDYFANYFETTHNFNAKQLCEMYKIQYTAAHDLKDVNQLPGLMS